VPVAAVALWLAGCTGDGEVSASSPVGQFLRGTTAEPQDVDAALPEPPLACPPVEIAPGTEAIRRPSGDDEDDSLRWQASILRTARECAAVSEGEERIIIARVGLSGRVIEGAQGAPDAVELPLRIAVRQGGEVTSSRRHTVRVQMTGASEAWALVDDSVRIDAPDTARIVVGFDA
jgi:hypothetical protein